jgi:hypothetical protein
MAEVPAFGVNRGAREINRSGYQQDSITRPGSIQTKGITAKDFALSVGGAMAGRAADRLMVNVENSIDNLFTGKGNSKMNKPNGKSNKGNGSNDGNGGSGKRSRRNSSGKGTPFFLPNEREGTILSLNTGVRSGAVVNTHDEGGDNYAYSPAFMMCGEMLPEDNLTSLASSQLSSSLYHQYLTACQSLVNYGIGSTFNSADFFTYMHKIMAGLQVYYMIDSILVYTNDPLTNRNKGIYNLRREIGADELSTHRELEILLGNMPCPPRLLEVIRYMYQNFKFSDNPNAPIYRLCYSNAFHENDTQSNLLTIQQQVIADLRDPTKVGNIPAILNKAFPNWSIGELKPSSFEPIIDNGFKTFWNNSNVTYITSEVDLDVTYTCFVINDDSEYAYYMFEDDVDGLWYAMSSVASDDIFQPGIWRPISEASKFSDSSPDPKEWSSLLSYNGNFAPDGKWTVPLTNEVASQAGVVCSLWLQQPSNTFTERYNVHTDVSRLQYHTVKNMREATASVMEWIFNPQQMSSSNPENES